MTESEELYQVKSNDYYGSTRAEISDLLPENIERVLEIGCGNGSTLKWLKNYKNAKFISGVELNKELYYSNNLELDLFISGNIEELDLNILPNSIDLLLCLDVLEHLNNPWDILDKLYQLMKPGSVLIVSLPNISHKSVILSLLFKNDWCYQNSGILDKTHIRFFTKKTSSLMISRSNFKIEAVKSILLIEKYSKSWFLNKITLGLFKRFITSQYIFRASKL